ncbi:MAG TPA: hypothetical protein VM694_15700 [Polyangium sp.]|jgi:hypothetical protein|nr:hypothetical protein [Polyangium sp.]
MPVGPDQERAVALDLGHHVHGPPEAFGDVRRIQAKEPHAEARLDVLERLALSWLCLDRRADEQN